MWWKKYKNVSLLFFIGTCCLLFATDVHADSENLSEEDAFITEIRFWNREEGESKKVMIRTQSSESISDDELKEEISASTFEYAGCDIKDIYDEDLLSLANVRAVRTDTGRSIPVTDISFTQEEEDSVKITFTTEKGTAITIDGKQMQSGTVCAPSDTTDGSTTWEKKHITSSPNAMSLVSIFNVSLFAIMCLYLGKRISKIDRMFLYD